MYSKRAEEQIAGASLSFCVSLFGELMEDGGSVSYFNNLYIILWNLLFQLQFNN